VPALVLHASKEGEESKRALYSGPVITVAKAKAEWQVHIVDADGEVFHPEKFDKASQVPC
jgi:hypothetical protein